MGVGTGGDVEEVELLFVEEFFGAGIGAGGGDLGAGEVLINGGDDPDAVHASPRFELDLAEKTATDDGALEHFPSMSECGYGIPVCGLDFPGGGLLAARSAARCDGVEFARCGADGSGAAEGSA